MLKAQKGGQLPRKTVDSSKAKKRYLILTYFERYNQDVTKSDLDASGSIKEELVVEADKTHYPLPLNVVELTDMAQLRAAGITKAEMRTIIRMMGEVIQV